jgi:hypothetical protein
MKQVMLMIGTRKGGFLAAADVSRTRWELKGPIFKGVEGIDVQERRDQSPFTQY